MSFTQIWHKLTNFNKSYQVLNWVELSAANLRHNYNAYQNLKPSFDIFPVLKSNAYGHGLNEIAKILLELNPKYLVVDGYFEALKISKISKKQPVLIMGSISVDNYPLLKTKNFTFVVHDVENIVALGKRKGKVKIHLEINTGMNRYGIDPNEINKYLSLIRMHPNIELEGVMSHLADADNLIDQVYNQKQTKIFDETVKTILDSGFDIKFIHLAQSAGSLSIDSKYTNTIRLGLGLYGIDPFNSISDSNIKPLELKPVLSLCSTITKVIDVKKGEKVSYNGIFEAQEDTKIAVIPLGYYEGFDRNLSNLAKVKVVCETLNSEKIHFVSVAGRVCMNHTMLNIGQISVKVGDKVVLYSNQDGDVNTLQNLWKTQYLFPYTALIHINENIRRKIV